MAGSIEELVLELLTQFRLVELRGDATRWLVKVRPGVKHLFQDPGGLRAACDDDDRLLEKLFHIQDVDAVLLQAEARGLVVSFVARAKRAGADFHLRRGPQDVHQTEGLDMPRLGLQQVQLPQQRGREFLQRHANAGKTTAKPGIQVAPQCSPSVPRTYLPCPPSSPFFSKSCKNVILRFSGLENLKMESCNPALPSVPCPCTLPAPCRPLALVSCAALPLNALNPKPCPKTPLLFLLPVLLLL